MEKLEIQSMEEAIGLAVRLDFHSERLSKEEYAATRHPLREFLYSHSEAFKKAYETRVPPYAGSRGNFLLSLEDAELLPKELSPLTDFIRKEYEVFKLAHILQAGAARAEELAPKFKPGYANSKSYKRVLRNMNRVAPAGENVYLVRIHDRLIPRMLSSQASLFNQYLICEDILRFLQENLNPEKLDGAIRELKEVEESMLNKMHDPLSERLIRLKIKTKEKTLVPPRPKSFSESKRLVKKLGRHKGALRHKLRVKIQRIKAARRRVKQEGWHGLRLPRK